MHPAKWPAPHSHECAPYAKPSAQCAPSQHVRNVHQSQATKRSAPRPPSQVAERTASCRWPQSRVPADNLLAGPASTALVPQEKRKMRRTPGRRRRRRRRRHRRHRQAHFPVRVPRPIRTSALHSGHASWSPLLPFRPLEPCCCRNAVVFQTLCLSVAMAFEPLSRRERGKEREGGRKREQGMKRR